MIIRKKCPRLCSCSVQSGQCIRCYRFQSCLYYVHTLLMLKVRNSFYSSRRSHPHLVQQREKKRTRRNSPPASGDLSDTPGGFPPFLSGRKWCTGRRRHHSRGLGRMHSLNQTVRMYCERKKKVTQIRCDKHARSVKRRGERKGEGASTHATHGRGRMTIDSGIHTTPGRSTSKFQRLHQARSAVRYWASRTKGELHPTKNRGVIARVFHLAGRRCGRRAPDGVRTNTNRKDKTIV